MNFKQENKPNTIILRISGDLIEEEAGSPLIKVATKALCSDKRICILDISALRYINSNGISAFIIILTKFRNRGGETYLMNPTEGVKKLLTVTKLNSIFKVIQTEEEAMELFEKQ